MNLLNEWGKWESRHFPYVLDADSSVLESSRWRPWIAKYRSWEEAIGDPDFCESGDKRFHLGLIPVPFIGDLLNASVYVLMLNPGLGPGDYFEYKVPRLQRALLTNLQQEFTTEAIPFIFLDPQFAWHGGFNYWHERLRGIIEVLAESRRMSLAEARYALGTKFAVVQLVPYHSSTFVNRKALHRLPSVRLALDFVRRTVAERVRSRDAIVIVTRQVKTWDQCLPGDLRDGDGVIRYPSSEARGARSGPNTRGGRAILRQLGVSAYGHQPVL